MIERIRQLFGIETKPLEVPKTNEVKYIDVVNAWEVRWSATVGTSKYTTSMVDLVPQVEVFLTEDAANEFAESLRKAFRLIRYQSRCGATEVVVRRSGGEVLELDPKKRQAR